MRVAILGAGYAGITLARRLESTLPVDVDLVVVDDRPYHLLKHELHRVIRRPAVESYVTIPLDGLLDRATVRTTTVTSIDQEAHEVRCADGRTISYDYAAICLGAETAFHGLPGVERRAKPLSRLPDAHAIRDRFLSLADAGGGRAVVGGAGLSGIQVAGELAALAAERNAPVSVTLLEQLDDVAPGFPARFRRAVSEELVARGVDVRTGTAVVRATEDRLEVDGRDPIGYDQLVWTGGIRGPDALDGDRPPVGHDLRVADATFVVGDAGRIVDANGTAVPASAQSAVRAARTAAENLERLVRHDRTSGRVFPPRLTPFVFDSPGWLVSVGDGAVAQVGPSVVTGPAARAMKATVGAGYLTSIGAVRDAVGLVHDELGADR